MITKVKNFILYTTIQVMSNVSDMFKTFVFKENKLQFNKTFMWKFFSGTSKLFQQNNNDCLHILCLVTGKKENNTKMNYCSFVLVYSC